MVDLVNRVNFLERPQVAESADQFPEIIDQGEVVIFAINDHSANFKVTLGEKLKPIRQQVLKCDHLLAEGTRANIGYNVSSGANYETIIFRTFRSKAQKKRGSEIIIHPLEERADYVSMANKYGLTTRGLLLYKNFKEVISIINGLSENRITDPAIARNYITTRLTDLIYAMRLFMPGVKNLNEGVLIKMLFEFFMNTVDSEKFLGSSNNLSQIWELANEAFSWYFARVRDYENIIPTCQDLVTKLRGKKGIVIGKGHLPYLLTSLSSQPEFQPPPSWMDFVSKLPTEYQKAVTSFEKLAMAR